MTWLSQAQPNFMSVHSLTLPHHLTHCMMLVNPRRACAARVTVLGPQVFLSVCLSVTMFSATTRNETTKERYQKVQHYTGLILNLAIFVKAMRSTVIWLENQVNKPIC